jgi:hypothetical protein
MTEERTEDRTKDWRELCKAASRELDPAKLMELIAELNKALDERDKKRGKITAQDPPTRTDGQYLSSVSRSLI